MGGYTELFTGSVDYQRVSVFSFVPDLNWPSQRANGLTE